MSPIWTYAIIWPFVVAGVLGATAWFLSRGRAGSKDTSIKAADTGPASGAQMTVTTDETKRTLNISEREAETIAQVLRHMDDTAKSRGMNRASALHRLRALVDAARKEAETREAKDAEKPTFGEVTRPNFKPK